jgi:hypothetical protein
VNDAACAASFTLRLGLGPLSGFHRPLHPEAEPQNEFPASIGACILRFGQRPEPPICIGCSILQPSRRPTPGSLETWLFELHRQRTSDSHRRFRPPSSASFGAPGLRHMLFPPATPVMNFQFPPDVASPTKSTMSFRFPPSIASPDRPVTNLRLAPLFVSLALLTIGLRFASSARFLARREQLLPACAVCFSSCRSGCQLPIRYGIISYCETTTVQSVNASANPCNACGFHQGWCNCSLCAAFVGHSRQFALIFHRQKS